MIYYKKNLKNCCDLKTYKAISHNIFQMMETILDIQVLCILPGCFLDNCMLDPLLSNMLKHISHERYSNMMVEILKKISYETYFSDQKINVPCHVHLKITTEHKVSWLKCFDKTLSDLSVNDISAKILHQRMAILLDEVTIHKSVDICQTIKEAICFSDTPHEFISEIKEYLDKITP